MRQKKNAAKSESRRKSRNRWFIYRNQSRSFGANFRSRGTAEAFLRSIGQIPSRFDLIKERVA